MSQIRLSSADRRAAIIEAAIELFSAKGFRGTTTRELASAVGVSEPVLYQHFATKKELYGAILSEKAVAGDRAIPDFCPADAAAGSDDRAFLSGLAKTIVEWHTSDQSFIRLLLFSSLENHEFTQLFFERYSQQFFQQLSDFFALGMQQGRYREMDPMQASYLFIGMAAHHGLNLAIFPKVAPVGDPEQLIEVMVDIFLQGIRKQ